MRAKKIRSLLTSIAVIAATVFILFPILWLAISAFKYEKDIVNYPPTVFASSYTIENFKEVLDTFPFFKYLKNTAVFALGVVVTSLFFDSLAAYAYARLRFKGRELLFSLVLMTMMIPSQITLIPLYVEVHLMGVLDTYWGLILPSMCDAFGIFMLRSFFISLPKSLEEAGRIDGLSEFGIFFRIMVPLSKAGFLTLGIMCLNGNWNALLYPLILSSSPKTRTLPAALAIFVGERTASYGPAIACALLTLLPLVIVYFCAQKYFVEGIAMSGMKE